MGMKAEIFAAGKFKREIADCLEYGELAYTEAIETLPTTVVFSTLFQCVTHDTSCKLAAAFGIDPWNFNQHAVKYEQCNFALLAEVMEQTNGESEHAKQCARQELEHFERLHKAGFKFYFRPNG